MKSNRGRRSKARRHPVPLLVAALVLSLATARPICRAQLLPSRAEQAQAWLEYGVKQAKQNDPQSALEALKRAIEIDPALQSAYYNLGLVLYEGGEPAPAAHYFQQALKLSPGDRQAQRGLGLAYIAQGKYARALAVFKGLVDLTPDDPIVNIQLGRSYLALGKPRQAIPPLRKAAQLEADDPEVHLHLGKALAETNDVAEAEASLLRALQLQPDLEAAELLLVQLYVNSGRFFSAQTLVDKLLAKYPRDRSLLMAQVEIYEGLGLRNERRRAQEALVAVLPREEATAVRAQLAAECFAAGHYEQALTHLTKVRATYPDDPDVIQGIAECYLKLGQPKQAIQVLEQAARQGRVSLPLLVTLGDAYAGQGQYDQALAVYDQALNQDRNSLEALRGAVSVTAKLSSPQQMVPYLRRILAILPDSAESRVVLADQLVLLGEWGEAMQQYAALAVVPEGDEIAVESLSKLIRLAARTGNSLFELQLRQQRQQLVPDRSDSRLMQLLGQHGGRWQQAEQRARQMLEKHPGDPDVKTVLAELLHQSGESRKAELLLAEVLRHKPLHSRANYLKGRLAIEQDRLSAAIPFLKRAILGQPGARRPYDDLVNCAEATGQLSDTTDFLSMVLADAMRTGRPDDGTLRMVLTHLADGYQRQAGPQRVRQELVALSDAYPEQPVLAVTAARRLIAADQITEAVKYYSRAARSPGYMQALVEATEAQIDANPQGALATASRYLARAAQDQHAVALVAELLGARDAMSAAEKDVLQRLLSSLPGSADYQFAKVDLAKLLGQLAQTEARLSAEAATEPGNVTITTALAYALWQEGRPAQALARLDMVPVPGNAAVQALRATLLEQLGQSEQALEAASEALGTGFAPPQTLLLRARLLADSGAYQEALWEYCQLLARYPSLQLATEGVVHLAEQERVELSMVLTALSQVYAVCPQPEAIRELAAGLGDQKLVHEWLAARPRVGR